MKIPMEEAIEQLLDAYRTWLEESQENVTSAWLEHFEQHVEIEDAGGDPAELFVEV